MNNLARISLILNALLILAVAALYYIVFSGPETSSAKPKEAAGKPAAHATAQDSIGPEESVLPPAYEPTEDEGALVALAGPGKGIYFVNTDTLLEEYTVFKKAKQALEAKSRRFEQDMQNRMENLQSELMQAQQKVQSGAVPQAQIQDLEQQMMMKQQQLAQYRDEQGQKLIDEEQKLTKRLNDDIQKFMRGYARRRGYQYVLGYTSGGGILYANDSLDITGEVVRGINKK